MTEMPIVHVVDDDEPVRQALALLLSSAQFAVRTYPTALKFLEVATGIRTGCVLTDLRMPGLDGLALQRRLSELGLRLPVIVMTGHADVPVAIQALKAGAFDFLEKPFDDEQMLSTVGQAIELSQQARSVEVEAEAAATRLAALTPRERQVFDALVVGQSNKTIAQELGTSPRTVEVHRARLMDKLDAHSLPELVRLSIKASALPPGPPERPTG